MVDLKPDLKRSSSKDVIEDALEDIQYESQPRLPPEAKQAALAQALAVDPGLTPWSWRAVQFYLFVLCACFCSGDTGFDGTVMGGVNAMAQYQRYFGMSSAGASTGLVFGIYTVGALPSSYIPDKFGRRIGMVFGNCVAITGSVITATATRRSVFIGGRFLTGFGTASAAIAAKAYLAEITPPQTRGLFLGFLNSFFYVGQMAATGMMVSTGKWSSNLSWRLPLYIQVIPASLNVLFVFFCPESPRWLYTIGKSEKSLEVLAKLHSKTNDTSSPLIKLEMNEIEETIQLGGGDKRWWDLRSLFRTRADRWRSGIAIMMGFFGQTVGNNLITYFLPVLLGNAGITSQNRKLTLNFVNSVTSFIGALTGSSLADRIGRRKLLISATAGCVVALTIVAGLLSKSGDSARSNAGISFIYLFMVIFSFGWTPMQGIYAAEILSYEARAKGLALVTIVSQVATCLNTFAMPVALQKIKWKVYLIFIVWDAIECIVMYFVLVETRGLTLEEIEEVFRQPNPSKYSVEHRFMFKSQIVSEA
ncbi:general substrate transporter [Amylostereum chailletii]|nr:general substrate transporter [Amylostereum chailletii]